MSEPLNIALKEWDLVIKALLDGRQAVLLRKGGILEEEGEFVLEHQRFPMFPTFVHQDVESLKAEERTGRGEGGRDVMRVRAEPDRIRIAGWCEVVRIWEVPGRPALERLDDLHVWGPKLLDVRFGYRPEKPLYLVAVRAWRLAEPVDMANTAAYAGCKSWVPLEQAVRTEGSVAAANEEKILELVGRVEGAFGISN